jgi:ABC-2 type transport system ATP-binding protein
LLAGAGAHVATRHPQQLGHALTTAGLSHQALDDGSHSVDQGVPSVIQVEADAETVGRIAWSAGVALTELRAADGAGLEEMFLALTAETQRDRRPGARARMEGAVA